MDILNKNNDYRQEIMRTEDGADARSGPVSIIPLGEEAKKEKASVETAAKKMLSLLSSATGKDTPFCDENMDLLQKKVTSELPNMSPTSANAFAFDGGSFFVMFLQQIYQGQIVPEKGQRAWMWPMYFQNGGKTVKTYPFYRFWKTVLEEKKQSDNSLSDYVSWLGGELGRTEPPYSGAEAVYYKKPSSPERIDDTAVEHRMIMEIISKLKETANLDSDARSIPKIAAYITSNFSPETPPDTNGWRWLRCFGHLLAEMLAQDFGARWYNTDGEDGGWSMLTAKGTFVFPLGQIYKTAATGTNLSEFYKKLAAERDGK